MSRSNCDPPTSLPSTIGSATRGSHDCPTSYENVTTGRASDVVAPIRKCYERTMDKRLTRSPSSPQRSEMGSYPFDNLTLDIVTMGPTHNELYDKLLVFADSLSRWAEAVPFLGDPTAEQVMDAFLCHVACRYGWPRTIRSDGGSNLDGTLKK